MSAALVNRPSRTGPECRWPIPTFQSQSLNWGVVGNAIECGDPVRAVPALPRHVPAGVDRRRQRFRAGIQPERTCGLRRVPPSPAAGRPPSHHPRHRVFAPLLDATLNAIRALAPPVASVGAIALLYRFSTRRHPAWRDVWIGTVPAALALAVLAWGYGLYVRHFGGSSAAGAAATLILGLAFIYYSAQLLLYGGEIIKASAERSGHPISPPGNDVLT